MAQVDTNQKTKYRFDFDANFQNQLNQFAKLHQHDDRRDFKDAWERWVENNQAIINIETGRLQANGYEGDVVDKMFKSARYYFRKKPVQKPEAKDRRKYIGLDRALLDAMDTHIGNTNKDTKPAAAFDAFCQGNSQLIIQEATRLLQGGYLSKEEITQKIKKTYKNRYFKATN
jgi:hypothetical protein